MGFTFLDSLTMQLFTCAGLFLYSLVSTVFLLNHKDMAVPIDFFTSVPFCGERKFQ